MGCHLVGNLLKVKPESDEDPPLPIGLFGQLIIIPPLGLIGQLMFIPSPAHLRSSFLRQLGGDEAAVLQSFRDINELIGDTLSARGRRAAMESELREMHGRYSQLSLQFAEVEGERQKLLMKLKNARSPRKAQP